MNYRPELSTDGGVTFGQNAQVFATREEAEKMAQNIYHRWLAATDYRVTETEYPVNYRIVETESGMVIEPVECIHADTAQD